MSDDVLAAALKYARRYGWHVFPVRGKVPAVPRGFKDATTDPATIERWFGGHPELGVAIATGRVSGIIALDIDGSAGLKSLKQYTQRYGLLPKTWTSKTPRGGWHAIYRYPSNGHSVRSSVAALGTGLDIRGDGGYIVAPPSPGPERDYTWTEIRHPDSTELLPCPDWLAEETEKPSPLHGLEPEEPIPVGMRNQVLTSIAGRLRRAGLDPDAIEASLQVVNQKKCIEPLSRDEVRRTARSMGRYAPGQGLAEITYEQTDVGNAARFADEQNERFQHVVARREWLIWRDRWRTDQLREHVAACEEMAKRMVEESVKITDPATRKRALRHAFASQEAPRIRRCLELAAVDQQLALRVEQLDSDPWLLSAGNGTIDLRTGDLHEPRPEQLISLGTDVPYDPDADCPRWQRFLEEVFDEDMELVTFVHRAVGYSLTGDTREHALFVCHGSGRNGKTTFLEAIKAILGDFAKTSSFETFNRSHGDRGPRNDIARLYRSRLVAAFESGEGRKLDEATVKTLTGGDTVTARFLYNEEFEYRPGFKLWLVTNHRPRVDGSDDAIWARLKLIPFAVSFLGREDRDLEQTIRQELPGILNWAVRGCLEWQKEGLGTSQAVKIATAEYRREEDILGSFIAERCVVGYSLSCEPAEFREQYNDYCKAVGEKPVSAVGLGRALSKRGYRRSKTHNVWKYEGIGLVQIDR